MLIATLARKNRQTVVTLISLVLILETETKTQGLVLGNIDLGYPLSSPTGTPLSAAGKALPTLKYSGTIF